MTTNADVVAAFKALRDACAIFADSTIDAGAKASASGEADAVGNDLETFDHSNPSGGGPAFDAAVQKAAHATDAVQALASQPVDIDQLNAALDLCDGARAALNALTPRRGGFGLVGALRVAPTELMTRSNLSLLAPGPFATASPRAGARAADAAAPSRSAVKPYLASLILLFPTEAVTLFPIGRGIAEGDPTALGLVIAIVGLFVVALRWFGTKDPHNGKPAVREIAISLVSYLLWVGSIGGYAVRKGGLPSAFDGAQQADLFAFAIIMWVAIVPYFTAGASGGQPKSPPTNGS